MSSLIDNAKFPILFSGATAQMSYLKSWWVTDYADDIFSYFLRKERTELRFRGRSPQVGGRASHLFSCTLAISVLSTTVAWFWGGMGRGGRVPGFTLSLGLGLRQDLVSVAGHWAVQSQEPVATRDAPGIDPGASRTVTCRPYQLSYPVPM